MLSITFYTANKRGWSMTMDGLLALAWLIMVFILKPRKKNQMKGD